jgi:hypothetical protein
LSSGTGRCKGVRMHLSDGTLRAYHDQALNDSEREQVRLHLAGCAACREQAELVLVRAQQVGEALALLAPRPDESALPLRDARIQLNQRLSKRSKEQAVMSQRFSFQRYRTAWVGLAAALAVAVGLSFPPVRALAVDFLGLFRVQKIAVVQINPELPETMGNTLQLEQVLANNVQVEDGGRPQEVGSAAEASAQAGMAVRLPGALAGTPKLMVKPAARVTMNVDLELVRALLAQIGHEDVTLPDELDGAEVTASVPTMVMARYGECPDDDDEQEQEQPARRLNCTMLMQLPSPTISAPPGLDVAQIGEAFLQVMGLSREEAQQFSQTVDWTTTLVVPIPLHHTSYRQVQVDSVTGTLIERPSIEGDPESYMLLWVKDGTLYALTGIGQGQDGLAIANSLQ